MATAWDADRTSYRIAVERDGAIQIVHRTMRYEETTAANDAVWALVGRERWQCRPVWRGAGFVAYHPDYLRHLGREGL
jgi:hypothetical protein